MSQARDAPKVALYESRSLSDEPCRMFSGLEVIVRRPPLIPNPWVHADMDLLATSSRYGLMMQHPRLGVCAWSQGGRTSYAAVEDGWW